MKALDISYKTCVSAAVCLSVCLQIFPDAVLHREEADYQAKLRAAKFEESQKAYKAGHKANAHELSVEVNAPSCACYRHVCV